VNTRGLRTKDEGTSPRESFPQIAAVGTGARVRRKITPEAGRGLEKLGHAIDYLTDEFVYDGCRFSEDLGRLHAIALLATLNRQIYFSCGIEPTLRQRAQGLFRRLVSLPGLRN
jgi:hypothetical protein